MITMPTECDCPLCVVWQVPARFARRRCERLSKTRGHWGEPDFSDCVDRELFILLDQVSSPDQIRSDFGRGIGFSTPPHFVVIFSILFFSYISIDDMSFFLYSFSCGLSTGNSVFQSCLLVNRSLIVNRIQYSLLVNRSLIVYLNRHGPFR